MKKIFALALCCLLAVGLCACSSSSGPEKQLTQAKEQIAAGEYAAAEQTLSALNTAESNALAEYCQLRTLVQSCDWSEGGLAEYTYSDRVSAALRALDGETLPEEYQAEVQAVSAANDLYVKNVQVVDVAYGVVAEQYTYLDDYASRLATGYKRDSKFTFLAGDMTAQLDNWNEIAQAASDALHRTLPNIDFAGLEAYRQAAIGGPSQFWYDALADVDHNSKVTYNAHRTDWEQYYKPARTEINGMVNASRLTDYAAVWQSAYAALAVPQGGEEEAAPQAA